MCSAGGLKSRERDEWEPEGSTAMRRILDEKFTCWLYVYLVRLAVF